MGASTWTKPGVWDESVPGGGSSTNSMASPQIMQALARMFGGGGAPSGAPGAGGGGGMMSPAHVGQVGAAPPVPNVGGMQPPPGVGGPAPATMTPSATAAGPGRNPPIDVAGVNRQTEWDTKSGRNMAVTENALQGLGQAVHQYKQTQFEKKQQAAKAAVLQKVMMSQDPQAQQQMQKLSQSDPKMAKIFEKQQADFAKYYDKAMTDPNSPEYHGFQQAYSELQQQAAFKDKMELVKQQIQAEMSRGEQEREHAALYKRQAELEGVTTDKTRYEESQKNLRITTTVQGALDRTDKVVSAMRDVAQKRADAMRDVAKARGATAAKTQNKALDYIAKDYTNLLNQIKELDKQSSDLKKRITEHPITTWWTGEKGGAPEQLQAIEQQKQILGQRLQTLEQQRALMIQNSAAPADFGEPQMPIGSADDPIVVDPKDMQ